LRGILYHSTTPDLIDIKYVIVMKWIEEKEQFI